ncbi:MAG: beta-lactamase family protein, partial [Candidatus Heimdallarchaeota archaeon]|nr:beta-lactamase family protein [Candidatus Heimdallarchaeota archaeon]
MDAGHFANLKTKMLDHTNHLRNPGLSYTISKDNVLVDSQFIGYRDIEKKLPIEKNTVFRIYSMTKPITTVVALMLIQEGKLDFKDTMTKFLPDLSNLQVYVSQTTDGFATEEMKREILIQDLLTCQAGFSYGFIASHPVDRLYRDLLRPRVTAPTKSEMLTELVTIPLFHQPGTQWHYGLELDVLGFILEQICQRDLKKIFYEYLFSKLSMFSTGFYVNP